MEPYLLNVCRCDNLHPILDRARVPGSNFGTDFSQFLTSSFSVRSSWTSSTMVSIKNSRFEIISFEKPLFSILASKSWDSEFSENGHIYWLICSIKLLFVLVNSIDFQHRCLKSQKCLWKGAFNVRHFFWSLHQNLNSLIISRVILIFIHLHKQIDVFP